MIKPNHILVSVIVPTYNRCELLRELLESLCQQSLPPDSYEIIVADNCSSDATGAMVAEMARRAACDLRYHLMPENKGPVLSRNTGAAMARGGILAFTDSDCRVSPQWLEKGVAPFSDPEVALVSGSIFDKPGQEITFFSVGGDSLRGENPVYPTANVFYRREAFFALNCFDESLFFTNFKDVGLFECGDADLAWRIHESKFKNVFVADAVVFHEVRKVSPWVWLVHQMRPRLLPVLAKRHPAFRRRFLWWGPFAMFDNFLFYLALLGSVLALLLNGWFLMLAAPMAYRMCWPGPGQEMNLRFLIRLPARLLLLLMRQTVICGSLLYGSIQARILVM